MTTEARINEVHSRLLAYGDYVNIQQAAALLKIGYNTVRAAITEGHERGWYETRPGGKRNPQTGGPALEYRAIAVIEP